MDNRVNNHMEMQLLRALEPEDLDWLYRMENSPELWEFSGVLLPYSKDLLRRYIERSGEDVYVHKQVRFVIDDKRKPVGLVDLYDIDFRNYRAGVGVVVEKTYRNKGYAGRALEELSRYAFEHLRLSQLYATVSEDNLPSRRLFESAGYENTAVHYKWNFDGKVYKNELLYQLFAHVD